MPPRLNVPGYWGVQNRAAWATGQSGARPLCSLGMPPDSQMQQAPSGLWRVSVAVVRATLAQADAPVIDLTWGAGHASQALSDVLLPAVVLSPGFLTVQARLVAPATAGLEVVCEVTPVHSGCCDRVVTLHDASGGAVALPPTVVRVEALAASTVTPWGAPAPIALAAGETIRAQGPCTLNTGVAYAEHVL